MRITVTPMGTTDSVYAVRERPGLLAFMFGRRERDFFAVRVAALRGGHVWIDDKTGRPIASLRILSALDRAHRTPRVVPFRTVP